jgi:hypothetical protein
MIRARWMLQRFDPELNDAKIDLDKTFDARFVGNAEAAEPAAARPADGK